MSLTPLVFGATTLSLPSVNYTTILPELILLGGALFLLALSALSFKRIATQIYALATIGFGTASLICSIVLWRDISLRGAFVAIAHSVDADGFTAFIYILVSCIVIIASIFAVSYLKQEQIEGCEYYALALISCSGAMFMASANDLVLIFLGLEILSIPLYVMAGFDQRRETSGEAAMKYFVLGAFSSAIFVYGIALTYGATGSTNLSEIAAFLSHNIVTSDGVLLGGLALLIVGFGFKVAAVPFHMWTPDVYQGSPTPAAGFMAAIAKAGAFAALLRVLISSFPTLRSSWQPALWVIATITLLLGAVIAIVQADIKRLLAYSSINNAGFVLVGVQAASARGAAASLYYVFVYAFLVMGAFAVISIVGGEDEQGHAIAHYRGLGHRQPALAVVFALFFLALAGAPFTTGFFSKLYVIEASVAAHSYGLAVVAMASAAIAAFFYLRVIFVMFGGATEQSSGDDLSAHTPAQLDEPDPVASGSDTLVLGSKVAVEARQLTVSLWSIAGLSLCLGVTIVFGFWPQPLIDFAHQATLLF